LPQSDLDFFCRLVTRAQERFREAFRKFIDEQKQEYPDGADELKVESNGKAEGWYRKLCCLDFVTRENGETMIIELDPGQLLSFESFSVERGRMRLQVDGLAWDDVVIRHDLPHLPPDAIGIWFDRWFGPDDRQTDMIHSLRMNSGELVCDFGTAPEEALYALLDLLEKAGAKTVRIGGGRTEDES
jgi:hypothetical protein